jgi:hypothetical protein
VPASINTAAPVPWLLVPAATLTEPLLAALEEPDDTDTEPVSPADDPLCSDTTPLEPTVAESAEDSCTLPLPDASPVPE